MTPVVEGLSRVTLTVRDLARGARFLVEVPGAEEVCRSEGVVFSVAAERFFVLGGVWLALMQGERRAQRGYEHVAFKIAEQDFEAWQARLRRHGVETRPPRPRVTGEGRSLYFHDYDDHLFELHTGTLEQRLARYRGG